MRKEAMPEPLTGSGIYYSMARVRPDLLAPRDGEHVWVIVVAHVQSADTLRKAYRGEQVNLDAESVANVSTGCFVCEQSFSERLSYRKCTGEPPA